MKHPDAGWFVSAAGAALLALGVGWPTLVMATSADAPMSIEALTRSSSHVVRGTVRSIACHSEQGAVFTNVEVRVAESLKGASPATVVVRLYGGTHDGRRTVVLGAPSFHSNEEVLLFLRAQRRHPTYGVVGLAQGKFDVARVQGQPTTVRRDLSGITFRSPPSDREPPATLNEIEAAVQAAAR